AKGENFFNWVQVHPLMSAPMNGQYPFEQAGIGETSVMLALWPEAVEAGRFGGNASWCRASASEASAELGRKGVAMILEHLRALLSA
ncbi:creatininase family protein, partial [Mesorhizobium sp. M2E.F.Ca.ET.166.01.1.1]